MFPSVTVCPYPHKKNALNSTVLSECGIKGEQYFLKRNWSNQSIERCADPKLLFNDIIWKLKDLITKFEVRFFNLSFIQIDDPNSFYHIDNMKKSGRCYTYIPSSEILENGIFRIILKVEKKLRIYISSTGVLGVKKSAENQYVDVEPGEKRYKVNIEHNIYKMLDFEGKPCQGYVLHTVTAAALAWVPWVSRSLWNFGERFRNLWILSKLLSKCNKTKRLKYSKICR